MKRVSIAGLGAIALIAALPFSGTIPGVPSLWNMSSVIASNTQHQPQVHLQLDAEKQVVQQDKENKPKITWKSLSGQAAVIPGDVLRYTISAENFSDHPVKNLTIKQPIPKAMVYVLKSATINGNTGTKIAYSIDGGHTFVENPTVKVTLPSGKVETRPAPATAYTNISWNFGTSVLPKTTIKGTYQLQVR
jgi:uncharacterized repeat protein (TIGR01451 family)